MKFDLDKFTKVFRRLCELQEMGIRTKKRDKILAKEFNKGEKNNG